MIPDASCYAVRRVNPFLGVTQVVEYGIGRALSSDGRNWEIQLAVQRPAGWGSLNRQRGERQFYRYGAWSAAEGLASFPVHPRLDPAALHESAQTLIAAVQARRPRLPFALADRFELWLLDAAEVPIALLATVAHPHLATTRPTAAWSAAPAHETGFGSAAAPASGPRGHVERLEDLVARRGRSTRWFERGSPADPSDRRPPAPEFPELPLSSHWPEPDHAALVADYLDWLAPRLLTLPLANATRERLERAAAANPALVDRLFPLYPAIIDRPLLNRIRVAARLSEATAQVRAAGAGAGAARRMSQPKIAPASIA